MKHFDQRVADASQMSRDELLAEVNRRIAVGELELPASGPERVRAMAMAVLMILGERYRATSEKLESLT